MGRPSKFRQLPPGKKAARREKRSASALARRAALHHPTPLTIETGPAAESVADLAMAQRPSRRSPRGSLAHMLMALALSMGR